MTGSRLALLLIVLLAACSGDEKGAAVTPDSAPTRVRVAAVQCPSRMGATAENLRTIERLAREAAARGAKIVVFPECAVHGYMDAVAWNVWSRDASGPSSVRTVAETVPGPSVRVLGALAKELGIYLCAGMVEVDGDVFHNAQVLLGPSGKLRAHHRKRSMWPPGDDSWCTPGEGPVTVVDTEYGRLGLMICHDFHLLPPHLAAAKVDIVLYSVGWYGPNEKNWFSDVFPRRAVVPHGFDVVASNWTSATPDERWPGRGHSCVIERSGEVLAMIETVHGTGMAVADLSIRR